MIVEYQQPLQVVLEDRQVAPAATWPAPTATSQNQCRCRPAPPDTGASRKHPADHGGRMQVRGDRRPGAAIASWATRSGTGTARSS